jgi:hypothetical protein
MPHLLDPGCLLVSMCRRSPGRARAAVPAAARTPGLAARTRHQDPRHRRLRNADLRRDAGHRPATPPQREHAYGSRRGNRRRRRPRAAIPQPGSTLAGLDRYVRQCNKEAKPVTCKYFDTARRITPASIVPVNQCDVPFAEAREFRGDWLDSRGPLECKKDRNQLCRRWGLHCVSRAGP